MSNINVNVCQSCGSPTLWLPVDGFPMYEVSNKGEVRNVKTGQMIRPRIVRGYRSVNLFNGSGKGTTKYVHALVCSAFHGPRPDGHYACHYPDPSKLNNHADNLEWSTPKKNSEDYYHEHGAIQYKPRAKLNADDVRAIRAESNKGRNATAIAKDFGIDRSYCTRIINYDRWSHI